MKSGRQRGGRPVTQDERSKRPARLSRELWLREGPKSRWLHVDGNMAPADAIPVALEPSRPVGKMMHLVQEQSGCPPLRTCFRLRPTALPEARKSCVRLVASSVHGSIAKFCGYFQKQRGLSHLPRPGQKLDAGRGVFAEAVKQGVAAAIIGAPISAVVEQLVDYIRQPVNVWPAGAESPNTAAPCSKVDRQSSADTTCRVNFKGPGKFLG